MRKSGPRTNQKRKNRQEAQSPKTKNFRQQKKSLELKRKKTSGNTDSGGNQYLPEKQHQGLRIRPLGRPGKQNQ